MLVKFVATTVSYFITRDRERLLEVAQRSGELGRKQLPLALQKSEP